MPVFKYNILKDLTLINYVLIVDDDAFNLLALE